jgi:hypothetical protein
LTSTVVASSSFWLTRFGVAGGGDVVGAAPIPMPGAAAVTGLGGGAGAPFAGGFFSGSARSGCRARMMTPVSSGLRQNSPSVSGRSRRWFSR